MKKTIVSRQNGRIVMVCNGKVKTSLNVKEKTITKEEFEDILNSDYKLIN